MCMTVTARRYLSAGKSAWAPAAQFASASQRDIHATHEDHLAHPAGELDVFTISLHQAHNYPVYKPPSSIDIICRTGPMMTNIWAGWTSR